MKNNSLQKYIKYELDDALISKVVIAVPRPKPSATITTPKKVFRPASVIRDINIYKTHVDGIECTPTVIINNMGATGNQGIQGIQGEQGQTGISEDAVMKYDTKVDFVDDNLSYKGEAIPSSSASNPVWRILRTTVSLDNDITQTWANGSADFIHSWDDRSTYTY